MSKLIERVIADRTTRNAARAAFDANLAQVHTDLAARSVGGRIADKASDEAQAVLSQTLAVARESKGIIAAIIAALVLWFLRQPLLKALAGSDPAEVQEDQDISPITPCEIAPSEGAD